MSIESKGFFVSLALLAGALGFLYWNRKKAESEAKAIPGVLLPYKPPAGIAQ